MYDLHCQLNSVLSLSSHHTCLTFADVYIYKGAVELNICKNQRERMLFYTYIKAWDKKHGAYADSALMHNITSPEKHEI